MGKIRPSEDACKKFVTEVLPLILQDLKRKGKIRIIKTDDGSEKIEFVNK